MDCGVPFCHNGCPLGNVIPDFNDLVYQGRWQAALRVAPLDQQLPRVHRAASARRPASRPACWASTSPPVTIKAIEVGHHRARLRGGLDGAATAQARAAAGRVAVVGSGPAGLAAADQLNRAGHAVTVFERADRIGGLLRYGIPDFKLGKDVLDRRLELMAAEGITFRTGVHVGVDYPAAQLLAQLRRRRPGRRLHGAARPAHPRARRCPASSSPWTSCARPTAAWPATPSRMPRPSWPPARTSSSSAAATRARTAWAPPSARAPAR